MKRISTDTGVSIIFALFMLVVASVFALTTVMLTQSSQRGAIYSTLSNTSYFAAQSGIEWAMQAGLAFTTVDKQKWLDLNGIKIEYAPAQSFLLNVLYDDPDNSPLTDDSVTITSQGFSGNVAGRSVMVTVKVPPATGKGELFSDHFNQGGVGKLNSSYTFGVSNSSHGKMTPYRSALNTQSGDAMNIFTHGSEPSGVSSVLRMGPAPEARIFIHTGSCLKWNVGSNAGLCSYSDCESKTGCEARTGINAPKDIDGYQNYFIKIKARLISGDGFGIYFRASYPNETAPDIIDFSGLTGYAWQYDRGMGYFEPCDGTTTPPGTDLTGLFFTRRVENGSETCGTGCDVYASESPSGDYPFFCPENYEGLQTLGGWGWGNSNWPNLWRTIYLYIYRDTMRVYLGREEVYGHGSNATPLPVGVVDLSQISPSLASGGIGIRTWAGSVAEIDYIKIYENNENHTPDTFAGE
ncbi:hypothetical protein MNBD_NITROSPINAE01-1741 [hydrothermal vent metagenome]|uniref:Uncharacterized protein n=1 Tax=hydrothermal vent metagenome TaxID=652676 RepID=A0A3B1BFY7_9ZZZZ